MVGARETPCGAYRSARRQDKAPQFTSSLPLGAPRVVVTTNHTDNGRRDARANALLRTTHARAQPLTRHRIYTVVARGERPHLFLGATPPNPHILALRARFRHAELITATRR